MSAPAAPTGNANHRESIRASGARLITGGMLGLRLPLLSKGFSRRWEAVVQNSCFPSHLHHTAPMAPMQTSKAATPQQIIVSRVFNPMHVPSWFSRVF